MTTKATIYLDSDMYRTFKLRALETGQSVSSLLNDAMEAQLSEDLEDISSIRSRLSKKEKPLSYDTALKELRNAGLI
ncbi:MAG: CopG family transcriptional regulator [Candidatus Saccharimonadales bacterium]